jgi:hypothetical protein
MADKYATVVSKAGAVSQDPAEIDTNVTVDAGATAEAELASEAAGGGVGLANMGFAGANAVLVIGTYDDDANGSIGTLSEFAPGHGTNTKWANEKLAGMNMGGILPGGPAAQGTLTIAEPVTTTDQFTIGLIQYTLITTPVAPYDIAIGADEAATKVNIVAAINASGTPGTEYFAGTLQNPLVEATTFATDACILTARDGGLASDLIVIAETGNELTHAANIFDAATLGAVTEGFDFADVTSLEPIGISADVALKDQNA